MADQQSIIALNIGSQRISMGVFAPTKKGLILKKYAATSILADPATEAARIPQVQLAIKELAKGLKVDKQKTAYALSGQSVFVRFVKLPPLEAENMDELVRFEAQQNVPFPIDEVVWDWEKLDTEGIENEVVLVAIKADSLNDLNSVVADTGLGTRLVDSAPTALYNSFRYNYPGLEECVLLLDIGAKTSNLIYADGKKFFTRSVSIGGANLTSAIAKEYNVSFAEAENSKLTSGLVTLGGGHAGQLDEATAALGTVVRNALTRLTAEVQRTNTLFRSQQGGNAPQKVLLAGGTANLPYLREFLEEKLSLPVESFNPLQRISVGKGVDVDAIGQEAHQLGELVGLSLRASDKAEISIDLVPEAVQAQRDITRRKPALITAAALFIVGLGAWAGFKTKSVSDGKAHLATLDQEAQTIQQAATKIKKLLKNEKESVELINAYAAAENGRLSFVKTWNDVSKAFVSENVWLTDLEYRTKYQVTGDAKSEPVMDESFSTATYGNSPLMKEETWVDSIVVRGLHLNKQTEVLDILEKLKNSEILKFVDSKDKPIPDNQLARIKATPEQETNDYAAPFEMLIPLKKAFQHK
ncbi:MAG: Amuc_1101 family PilM-like pilus complex protein [Akkermansiaceae bacterium]